MPASKGATYYLQVDVTERCVDVGGCISFVIFVLR